MKHLSICNFGDCLGVSGNRLTVRSKEGELQEYCLTHLRSICIAKNGISISSNLVQACAARGIRLYFLDWTGKSTACISGEHQHAVVQVRKAQFRAIESVLSHFLSREIILAKLRNQRAVLLYGSSSKTPVAKPDGTKMFCSAFLNDARMCCFLPIQ